MPSHAIIIENDEVKQTCLIDIPFTAEFEPVKNAITLAASKLNLTAFEFSAGDVFTEKVISETRSARLVVAVCAPDARFGAANPNVMYELGLARAIGKPILLMTSDGSALPADVLGVTALEYAPAEVAAVDGFVRKIKEKMREVLDASPNCITDSRAKVWVTEAKHRMLLKPEFWGAFNIVFGYANSVRHEAGTVYWDLGHDIARYSSEMLGRAVYNSPLFWNAWDEYVRRYPQLHSVLLQPSTFAESLEVMNRLAQLVAAGAQPGGRPMAASPDVADQIRLIRSFCDLLATRVGEFEQKHRDAFTVCTGLQSASSNEGLMNQFNVKTPDLVQALKEAINVSNGLVNNLVTMLAKGFELAKPSTNAAAA
jgi:nucleoside 2-deoxyribosyltransferase